MILYGLYVMQNEQAIFVFLGFSVYKKIQWVPLDFLFRALFVVLDKLWLKILSFGGCSQMEL